MTVNGGVSPKRKQNAVRLWQIFRTSSGHCALYLYERITKSSETTPIELFARRLRRFLEELGPTFVKIGQLLSVRPDLVPPEVIHELEKLQESVPPFDFKISEEQIRRELGKPIDALFLDFQEKPIAAGSVAQVHKAKLIDGSDVIVKVQRPEAQEIIEADLGLLYSLATLLKRLKRFQFIDPVAVVQEWSDSLHRELDFRIEGRHADRFRFIFRKDPLMKVPWIYWPLTGKRVLTMGYIKGYRLTDLTSAERKGVDTYSLAEHGARVFIKEVLEDGFFHGDLHPSNILITPEGEIAYLDFGIVGTIGNVERRILARLTVAIIEQDIEEVVKQARLLGVDFDQNQIHHMKEDLKKSIERYVGRNLGEIKIDNLGKELMTMLYRRHVRIPRNYVLLTKAMITVEGVAKGLYPEFNIIEVARPYLFRLVRSNLPAAEMIIDLFQRVVKFSHESSGAKPKAEL